MFADLVGEIRFLLRWLSWLSKNNVQQLIWLVGLTKKIRILGIAEFIKNFAL